MAIRPSESTMSPLIDGLDYGSLWAQLHAALDTASRTAPGLMVAATLALAIPLLATLGGIGLLSHRLVRRMAKRAEQRKPRPVDVDTAPRAGTNSALLIEGQPPLGINGHKTLTVLGRDGGCDIWLDHASVASHHAAIERTLDDEFWITDLTGPGGSGVRVDNRPVARRRLTGGERIGIGAVDMTFQTVPGRSAAASGLRRV